MTRRRERFRICGATRRDRQEMTTAISGAIQASGGWLVDFTMFSNISICFNVEVARGRLGALYEELARTGLRFEEEGELSAAGEGSAEEEMAGTIQVTFVHEEPDLRREVPAIPG